MMARVPTPHYRLKLSIAKSLQEKHGKYCSMFRHIVGTVGRIEPLTESKYKFGTTTHWFIGNSCKIAVELDELELVSEEG